MSTSDPPTWVPSNNIEEFKRQYEVNISKKWVSPRRIPAPRCPNSSFAPKTSSFGSEISSYVPLFLAARHSTTKRCPFRAPITKPVVRPH
ncbi:uncharacterized protein H6S33_008815 [Morchella sextelata]|uniref:uncharacterized protein n=1 Tax=Morchella sextelata TaxID=1174677 RepID=UPI001D04572F|nr:uncharacterized protein H6S33_008815 [Morchella sextelata]KAH0602476.1 hypothetical protein H6S33_008815 [Morchella sextelata]